MANGEVTPSSITINKNAVVNNGKLTMKDVKAVIKLGIVNSNLFTVFAGYWLALYFTIASFLANIDVFVLTMLGSTFVLIGASVLNNWYDVDIDPVMNRTRKRPTVTGKIPLQTVFLIGVVFTLLGLTVLMFTTVTAALVALVGWFSYIVLYTIWEI